MSFLPILAAIGGAAQVVGTIATASANAKADKYNQQVEQRNAQIALSEGSAQAAAQQRINEQKLGKIQATYGANGIEFGGDALGVYQDSATQANYDLVKTRFDAKMRSIGYVDQANLDGMKAKADTTAGILGAFGAGAQAGTSILKAA